MSKTTNDTYKVLVLCWVTGFGMCGYQNTQIIASCLKGHCQIKKENSDQGQNAGLANSEQGQNAGLATPSTVPPVVPILLARNKTCPTLNPVGDENREGWTPLHEAAHQGRLAVAKCLVEAGADVNAYCDRGIPLLLAAAKGHLEVVKFLVEKGSDINAKDGRRYQALQLATMNGWIATVRYLLDKKAVIDHGDSWTSLHEAAALGFADIARLLVDRGADVNAQTRDGTPVHLAARSGHLEILKYLVEHGGRVDTLNSRRYQPLQLAAWHGHTACVKYLLDKGAVIEHGDSWTALHEAANYGYMEMAKLLVEKGGNVNTMTKDGTPVHLAARNGHLEVLKYLVEKGGNVNVKDSNGYSPLQLAAWHGHTDTVKYLLDKGAYVDSRNKQNWTPLHEAANYGYLDIAKLFVEKGANVNAMSIDGTPLQVALKGHHSPVVELLKANGAS